MAAKKKASNILTRGKECRTSSCAGGSCAFYGLGFLGAVVYYISTATGFWNGVWGFVKALLWPAFLVHALLKFVGA